MIDADYLDRKDAFDDAFYSVIPEVWPPERGHDDWDGAAGCEIRDGHFEPYPHRWDYTLRWCRVRFALYYKRNEEINTMGRSAERIPGWILRRALPNVERRYQ